MFFLRPHIKVHLFLKNYVQLHLNYCNHIYISCLLASRHEYNTCTHVLRMRVVVRVRCTRMRLPHAHKIHIHLVVCVCATHTKVCVPHGNARLPAGGRCSHEERMCALCAQKCAHAKRSARARVCVRTHSNQHVLIENNVCRSAYICSHEEHVSSYSKTHVRTIFYLCRTCAHMRFLAREGHTCAHIHKWCMCIQRTMSAGRRTCVPLKNFKVRHSARLCALLCTCAHMRYSRAHMCLGVHARRYVMFL